MTERPFILSARLAGSRFPRTPWEGKIAGSYDRAANIMHPSGLALSLVADEESMTALSVRVALPPGTGSLQALLAPEERPHGRERPRGEPGVIPAAGTAAGLRIGELTIDLRPAHLWSGSLSLFLLGGRFDRAPRAPDLGEVTPLLAGALVGLTRREGLVGLVRDPRGDNPFASYCAEVLRSLVFRASNRNFRRRRPLPPSSRRAGRRTAPLTVGGLSPLVGLGIGLTPSGDDFLCGALLAERLAGLVGGGRPPLLIERGEIAGALSGTTAAGRALLWLALRNSFPAYLLELARAVVARDWREGIPRAVQHASAHGESSGSDAMTGFWWYLGLLRGLQS